MKNRIKKNKNLIKTIPFEATEILVYVLFFITLLPIIYVGLHNYETGDDYWYGVYTYWAWIDTGSLWQVIKAACRTVAEFYVEWQGTWFTMFLFAFPPNMWAEHGYYITIFIALGLLVAGTSKLLYYYLQNCLGFSRTSTAILNCLLLYLMLQYVPRTISALFWYNGVMHYSVPFYLACCAIVYAHRYVRFYQKKDFVFTSIAFVLLGGGSYLAPLAAFLAVCLILIFQIHLEKKGGKYILHFDKRNCFLLIPIVFLFIGLFISFIAPGNSVRGGEEFGFSIKWVLQTIYYAIDRGIYLGKGYFTNNPMYIMIFLLIVVIVWHSLEKLDLEKLYFPYPVFFILYTNALYWAVYTPEIYSRSDVSGGVHNTYQQVFLLVNLANIVYLGGWIQKYLKTKTKKERIFPTKAYLVLGLLLALITIGYEICDNTILTTNQYCVAYIRSGKMDTYAKVRDEQYRILTDSTIQDAVVPENPADYPVLNMMMSEEPHGYRNLEKEKYYRKNSIATYLVE